MTVQNSECRRCDGTQRNAKIVRNIRVGSSNFGVGDVTGPDFECRRYDGSRCRSCDGTPIIENVSEM